MLSIGRFVLLFVGAPAPYEEGAKRIPNRRACSLSSIYRAPHGYEEGAKRIPNRRGM